MPLPGAAAHDVEIEWQFDALDLRPVERWLATGALTAVTVLGAGGDDLTAGEPGPGGAVRPVVLVQPSPMKRLVDTYVDSSDWRVSRAGFALRVRRRAGAEPGGPAELTMKDRAESAAGLRRRLEVTEPLPSGGLDAIGPEGPVGRRVRALVGSRALETLFEVRTRRRPFVVRVDGAQVAEVALDDTVIDVRGSAKPLRMQRVEVEVDPGWVDRLAPVVEQMRAACGLQPATMSKFDAGLLGSGLVIPTAPDFGSVSLAPVPTVAEVAFVVLRRNLTAMLTHEGGTRLGDDPEDLHDMRVATRRMRAALDLFADALPSRAETIRGELGWVADALGAVRDLDVQMARLEQIIDRGTVQGSDALKELVHVLDTRRRGAREALLACLDSVRYERLVAGFGAMLRHGPLRRRGPANAPAVLAVPDLVRARHRAVAKAAKAVRRTGHPDDFHRLRIRSKRLRYALEFVAELYPGQTGRYTKRVVRVQDALGSMQDARVAAEQLHALAVAEDDGLSRETVFVLGGLAEHYRQDAATLARRVPQRIAALSDDIWRQMIARMDRRRLEMAPHYGWSGLAATGAAASGLGALAGTPTEAPSGAPAATPEREPDSGT